MVIRFSWVFSLLLLIVLCLSAQRASAEDYKSKFTPADGQFYMGGDGERGYYVTKDEKGEYRLEYRVVIQEEYYYNIDGTKSTKDKAAHFKVKIALYKPGTGILVGTYWIEWYRGTKNPDGTYDWTRRRTSPEIPAPILMFLSTAMGSGIMLGRRRWRTGRREV